MKRFDIGLERTYNKQPSWYPVFSDTGEYVKHSDVVTLKEALKVLVDTIESIAIISNNPNISMSMLENIRAIRQEFDI